MIPVVLEGAWTMDQFVGMLYFLINIAVIPVTIIFIVAVVRNLRDLYRWIKSKRLAKREAPVSDSQDNA